jgi:uncharacterized protein
MAVMKKVRSVELYMGKLRHGGDLLEEITEVCKKKNIQLGRVEAIGAVQKARLGYYSQPTQEYRFFSMDKAMEIISFTGNVSLKDGDPMVHAHVTLADDSGNAFGGHLAPGTVVFACEFILEVFEGPVFERKKDMETGLPLWAMQE